MYADHQALFVHAVASPYRDRSHFDGQNVLETGGTSPYQMKDGWLNRLVASMPATRENAKLRCHKIIEANQAMQPWLADRWQRLLEDREQIAGAMRTNSILASREYAFCLYPAEALRPLMEMPGGQ